MSGTVAEAKMLALLQYLCNASVELLVSIVRQMAEHTTTAGQELLRYEYTGYIPSPIVCYTFTIDLFESSGRPLTLLRCMKVAISINLCILMWCLLTFLFSLSQFQ